MVLSAFEKKKFVLIIGDDGAILAFFNGLKVEKRLFAPSPALGDRKDINDLISRSPNIPVYVLIDTMEQSYTKQTLPAVSALAINKLVKKRLERDFASTDIKGALLFERDKTGRHDWIYMFASTPVTPAVGEWMDFIASLENKFAGIFMLPVETETFARRLNKHLKKEEIPQWQFIITHNKTGGFRQILLQKGRVVFTRLIRHGKDNLPDIIAGNIEQEILNTIDYMRRLSLNDDEEVDVIVIASKEIKKSLANTTIRGREIRSLTPYDAAKAINMEKTSSEDDKFADIILAASFIKSKPILRLENPYMKDANTLLAIQSASAIAMVSVTPVLVIYLGFLIFSIYNSNSQLQKSENEKASIEREWKDARKTDQYNIDDANKITDFASLNKELLHVVSPLEIINDLGAAQESHATTRSLSWTYTKPQGQPHGSVQAIINLEFFNSGNNIEDLFRNFDIFTTAIKTKFTNYNIEMSELPSQVTFDNKSEPIPVQLKAITKPADGAQPNNG